MSSGSYRQCAVMCPYYISDDGKNRITCEGTGESCNITSYFRLREEYEKQYLVFCCRYYARCELARAIKEKYE